MNEYSSYLCHYGVMGMHWGIRRYQPYGKGGYNPDHKGNFIGKLKKAVKTKKDSVMAKVKLDIADTKKELYLENYRKSRNKAKKYNKMSKSLKKKGYDLLAKNYEKSYESESKEKNTISSSQKGL